MKLDDLKIGHAIEVNSYGMFRYGIITGIEEDIKNGRPGVSYTSGSQTFWCYLDQIMPR